MGFNKRKMEDQRRDAPEKEAANRRATEAQVLEDAERLIVAWNERQAKRLQRAIGFCGCAAPRAAQSTRLICAGSTVIPMRR
jgi:hypothetical protein